MDRKVGQRRGAGQDGLAGGRARPLEPTPCRPPPVRWLVLLASLVTACGGSPCGEQTGGSAWPPPTNEPLRGSRLAPPGAGAETASTPTSFDEELVLCAQAEPRTTIPDDPGEVRDWENDRLARRLDAIEAAEHHGMPSARYEDLETLSQPALVASYLWDPHLFREEALPFLANPPPSLSYCVGRPGGEDLVRLEYNVGANPLVVVESPTYALVLLPGTGAALRNLDANLHAVALRRLAGQFLMPWVAALDWQPRPPSSVEEGVAFAAERPKGLFGGVSYSRLMYAGVWRGQVYFLFFRQPPQRKGSVANSRFFEVPDSGGL